MVGALRRLDPDHGPHLGAGERDCPLGTDRSAGLLQDQRWIKTVVATLGSMTGIATALIGYSSRSPATKKEGARSGYWLALGAIIFLTFLLVYVAFMTSWLEAKLFGISTAPPIPDDYRYPVDYRGFFSTIVLQMEAWKILLLAGAFCLTGVLVGFLVNVNQFSLHAVYNARLTRAYLGASRGGRGDAILIGSPVSIVRIKSECRSWRHVLRSHKGTSFFT